MTKIIKNCYECPMFTLDSEIDCQHPKADFDLNFFFGTGALAEKRHPECPLEKESLTLKASK